MKNLISTSIALTVVLVLSLGLMSCDESPTTAVPGPDGATIAKKPGGGGGPGGGGDKSPFTNWAFAISDGSMYGNIHLLSADGSTSSRLTKGGREHKIFPTFTPDGAQIAYISNDGTSPLQLRLVGSDATNDRLVRVFGPGETGPAQNLWWLPGSSKLLYRGGYDLHVLDTVTTTIQSLGINALFPGEWIIVDEPSPGPDLSPDAGFQGRIAVTVRRVDEGDADIYVVMASEDSGGLITLDPGSLVRLPLPDTPDSGQNLPSFSPDGSAIAFVDVAWCCSGRQLKVVSFDAGSGTFGVPLLLDEPGLYVMRAPVWAPDGSWIGYTTASRGRGGTVYELYRIRPDGVDKTRVGPADPGSDWNPAWCNDIDSPETCG